MWHLKANLSDQIRVHNQKKNIFLISQPKHMLLLLKCAPKIYQWDGSYSQLQFEAQTFALLDL